jgi:hypothetical protein
MKKIGAVYCVYDLSVFLNESVQRIYPLMDMILFILNTKPWGGDYVGNELNLTYEMILDMVDPERKFKILTGTWENEASQRNAGLHLLNGFGIDWCMIIDDDELYNRSELGVIKNSLNTAEHAAYLIYHQIYWKNRNTIIDGLFGSFPTFTRTDGIVHFNKDRMIIVQKPHTWFTISASNIVCHHMSYVRSDSKMLRKIKNFSHAEGVPSNWYKEKWLNWTKDTLDLHPSPNSGEFKRAVSVSKSKYRLFSIF